MAGLTKVLEDDGTYSILAAGQVIRSSLSREDAHDVLATLRSMEPAQD